MKLRPLLGLPLALAAALLLPACGEDEIPTGTATNAILSVTVDPTPIPPSFNTLTGVVSIGYRIVITEINGLGGEVLFVSAQVYDPETGQQRSLSYFDGADLIVFVGEKRVEAFGTLEVPQTTSYTLPDARINALLAVNVQLRDDRDNLLNQSVLVKVE
jgi:hypothetical protein